MGNFVSEGQIKTYKTFIPGIREDLGRYVTIHIPGIKQRCFQCGLDPMSQKSNGIYSPQVGVVVPNGMKYIPFVGGTCPVCNAVGYINSETTKIAKALIRWLNTGDEKFLIQGIAKENDVRLKMDIKYKQDMENSRVVEVDGVPCQFKVLVPGGLRDIIQMKVFLKRSEWPTGKKTDVSKY